MLSVNTWIIYKHHNIYNIYTFLYFLNYIMSNLKTKILGLKEEEVVFS